MKLMWTSIRKKIKRFIQDVFRDVTAKDVSRRLENLEILLTEHPDCLSADAPGSPLSSPVVSVIMPTWNRASIVGAAIRSVQAQRFSDWELLVLDDGSTDDTAEVMAAFAADPRIRYIQLPHAGQCVARSHGHSIAKGALIAYLDSDNLWYPQFLAAAVAVFAHRPDVDCAYGALVSDIRRHRVLFEPFDRKKLLVANFIDMSTLIHRRSLVDRYGTFDKTLSPVEDWELALRYTVDAPAYRLPVLAARYRQMDDKRVSATQPAKLQIKKIRSKYKAGSV